MLPGADLVEAGLVDVAAGRESVESLLVSIGAPRLRRAGIKVPEQTFSNPEHRLYAVLCAKYDDAHSKYNALIRRLVSFEQAIENIGVASFPAEHIESRPFR